MSAPPLTPSKSITHHIEITGRTFSDQTGRFVCPSTSGNNYVYVVYDYDSNSIHALPIPTRKKEHILAAFQKIVKRLILKGLKPQLHKLDNEVTHLMKNYMESQQIKYELTPDGLHRRNLTERAIQTVEKSEMFFISCESSLSSL